jgi:hypothetical protein
MEILSKPIHALRFVHYLGKKLLHVSFLDSILLTDRVMKESWKEVGPVDSVTVEQANDLKVNKTQT